MSDVSKGLFITLEGGEGLGKSTNLSFICECLEVRGKRTIATREPGGTPIGEQIRKLFLGEGPISPETELLLVFAARSQHLKDVIIPALDSGVCVVCDRFTDASYAYQGGGRQVDVQHILGLEEMVQHGRKPDLTLLFDAPVEIGMARAKNRGAVDRMETEALAFYERVRQAYLQLAGQSPRRIKIVDASRPLEEVRTAIAYHLNRLCEA